MKNKETNNSVRPAMDNTLGHYKKLREAKEKELDRRAKLASNSRDYYRNMNNRFEKEQFEKLLCIQLGEKDVFLITASPLKELNGNKSKLTGDLETVNSECAPFYITEAMAVSLMGRFKNAGSYFVVVEKATNFHLHYIGIGKHLANYIVKGLKSLPYFKHPKAVHLLFNGETRAKVNYLLKGKHILETHFEYYFNSWKI
jgi:hypothetical protein